jgi:stage II sporulation protein D
VARSRGAEPVQINGLAYRGSVQVRSPRAGQLTVVNAVQMEDYLQGVVPREIGQLSPGMTEAAKAQAVAARTYSVARKDRRVGLGFNFYADERDQVYGGVRAENDEVNRAVRETAGQILVYRGNPIDAYYHSTCAGQTAAIEEVWNEPPRAYLTSVVDVNPQTGQAWDHTSSRFRWTTRWTAAQITEILNRTLADSLPAGRKTIGTLRDMRVLDRTHSGRVQRMVIETSAGNFTVGRDRVRWILLTPEGRILNSSKFDVRVGKNASGAVTEVVAEGGGWGHGIGMCQVGARNRAVAGQDYRQILLTYYTGAEIQDLY